MAEQNQTDQNNPNITAQNAEKGPGLLTQFLGQIAIKDLANKGEIALKVGMPTAIGSTIAAQHGHNLLDYPLTIAGAGLGLAAVRTIQERRQQKREQKLQQRAA